MYEKTIEFSVTFKVFDLGDIVEATIPYARLAFLESRKFLCDWPLAVLVAAGAWAKKKRLRYDVAACIANSEFRRALATKTTETT